MDVQSLINTLSLEEKCALLSGAETFKSRGMPQHGIPQMWLSDGPRGVRKRAGESDHLGLNPSVPATCFPTASAVANSWDVALGEEIGQALGEEAAAQDVAVLLGPGLNMKRNPLCGRNFEYFSEDPYLAGKLAAVQSGKISESDVDARLKELMPLIFDTRAALDKAPKQFDESTHHELARRAAAESLVLLKNGGSLLPFAEGTKVAVIGDFAETPRYQGAGSSMVNSTKVDRQCGLPEEYHLHTLRHYYATYLLQEGTSKQVTASLLGHADTAFLERTYCHPQDAVKLQAANLMQDLLNNQNPCYVAFMKNKNRKAKKAG